MNIEIYGGPITEEHTFLQFHAHWGPDSGSGSEHLVDKKSYAGEVFLSLIYELV